VTLRDERATFEKTELSDRLNAICERYHTSTINKVKRPHTTVLEQVQSAEAVSNRRAVISCACLSLRYRSRINMAPKRSRCPPLSAGIVTNASPSVYWTYADRLIPRRFAALSTRASGARSKRSWGTSRGPLPPARPRATRPNVARARIAWPIHQDRAVCERPNSLSTGAGQVFRGIRQSTWCSASLKGRLKNPDLVCQCAA
jgi:hypothetical protein